MTILLYKDFRDIVNMTNIDISRLKTIFAALANEKRLKIIELCSQKGYTVKELSRKVGLDYSITVEYTSMLQKANLISKTRQEDKSVVVKSLIRLGNDGEIKKIN